MPYTLDSNDRPRKDQILKPEKLGELTLAITAECLNYLNFHKEKFDIHAEILSALSQPLEGMTMDGQPKDIFQLKGKLTYLARKTNLGTDRIKGAYRAAEHEWYRRMTALYEQKKCVENGDVYPKGDMTIATRRILELTTDEISKLNDRITTLEQDNQVLRSPKIFKPKKIKEE